MTAALVCLASGSGRTITNFLDKIEEGSLTARVARVICDITHPDGTPFDGCPRTVLKRANAAAAEMGFRAMLGPEAEFFLFRRAPDGSPTTSTQDAGAYFDLAPIDEGEACRRSIVNAILWTAHRDFAPEGAPAKIEPADMELLPDERKQN